MTSPLTHGFFKAVVFRLRLQPTPLSAVSAKSGSHVVPAVVERIFSLEPSRPDSDFLSSTLRSQAATIPAVKRRTVLQTLPAAALLPASLWAASQKDAGSGQSANSVFELRIYHAAPGKLADLHTRFREHTMKIFERHGMKNVAYWSPLDEPDKSNLLIYILQHPSREAAVANWKSFQDDPEWKSVRDKSEANGKLVEKVDSTYMEYTDFSPKLR